MLADLVGRADEVRDVAVLLGAHRLVTVVGAAGVGKTGLSIEVARAETSRDGVWLVRLDSTRSGAEVPQTFGDALAMSGATRTAPPSTAGPSAWTPRHRPRSRRSAARWTASPLAIELAAARTKALSVQEIARRIEDRFGLLRDSSSRGPMRHRALSEAIRWSYDLLFPDDQVGCGRWRASRAQHRSRRPRR